MPTHNHNDPEPESRSQSTGEVDASAGYERSDASVTGIAVFLVSLLHLCRGHRSALLRHRQG